MEKRKRIERIAVSVILFVVIGLIYAFIVRTFHIAVPCIFRKLTGFRCPGCGITHAMLHLLRLDFVSAFRANMLIYPILLFVAWVFIWTSVHYVKTGRVRLGTGSNVAEIAFIVILVIWAIVRNIAGV